MIYSKINDDDVQCTICATDIVFLVQRVDKYAYYSCPNCTLITAVPKPTDLEIASFYNGFLYGMPKDEHFLGELEAKKKAVVRIDLDIKKYFNKTPLSLLDLGGGTGFYSECFKNLGYKTTLIDIDQKACNYAASHFRDIKVVNVDPFNYSPEEKYDVVFANQVIEHYRDIRAFMDSIKKFIKPNGLLIIATPNQQCKEYFFRTSWWAFYLNKVSANKKIFSFQFLHTMFKFIKKPWICCDPPRHIFSFNKKSLSLLSYQTNWRVKNVFTEYSPSMYYSGKPGAVVFRRSHLLNPFVLARFLYVVIGIFIVRMIDFKNNYGENLVIHLTPNEL